MLYNVTYIYICTVHIIYTYIIIHTYYIRLNTYNIRLHTYKYIYVWVTNHLPTGMHIQVSPFNQYGAHHQRLQQRHSKAQNPFSAGWFIYKGNFQSKMDDLGVP